MFAMRWVVQAYYSHRAGKPVTPTLFWVMSLIGSWLTLFYFVFSAKQDMVGVIGALFPSILSAYNLYLNSRYATAISTKKPTTMTAASNRSLHRSLEQAAGE